MAIIIDTLKNYPDAIPVLAKLWQEMLGKVWEPAVPYEEIKSWFDEWLNDRIPLAFVALDGRLPVGMCSLQLNDGMPSDLMPWLGDLCVAPAYQKRGIAKLLIEASKMKAKESGFKQLYLLAPDLTIPNYYKRLGWEVIGTDKYKEHPVTVMKFELSQSHPNQTSANP